MAIKITYRRTSRLSMRIAKNGDVHVSAPIGVSQETVTDFIEKTKTGYRKHEPALWHNWRKEPRFLTSCLSTLPSSVKKPCSA